MDKVINLADCFISVSPSVW